MSEVARVRLALATTVAMWAVVFVAIREAAGDYPLGAFMLLRFAIPSLVFLAWGLARGGLLPPPGDRARVLLLGVLFVTGIGLLVAGEQRVDAGTASILAETSPLFTLVGAAFVLGEGFGWRLLAGVGLSFCGAVVVAGAQDGGLHGSLGALLVLGAALAQAATFIVQRPLLGRQSALRVVSQATIIGGVATLPFLASLGTALRAAPLSATASIVFVALSTGLVSYVTLAYAMARSRSIGAVSSVFYLVPPGAVLISWLALGEVPSRLALLGGVVAITGVAIARATAVDGSC